MVTTSSMAEIAALVGEPTRAAMLQALMDGRALTATELANVAGIMPQTASAHLGRLSEAGLVGVLQQGRHRYHRLATPNVARMLESLMLVASAGPAPRTGPRDTAMRLARTCYDHIAGQLGVGIADAMRASNWVEFEEDAGLLTDIGAAFLRDIGLDPGGARLCRHCLDWSERRPHLSGRLGVAICRHSQGRGWVRKRDGGRALEITPEGVRVFRDVFGVALFRIQENAAAA